MPEAEAMSGAHVLVVDDDHSVRAAVRRVLARAGYEVETTSTAEAAVDLVRTREFEVAVSDFRLPGMDGVELLQHLREVQTDCSRILLTGMLDLPTAVNAINDAAVHGALQKPVSPDELVAAVEAALAARQKTLAARPAAERIAKARDREELERLLEGDFIELALQPIVRASDHTVYGYEGLLRSSHPVYNGPGPVLEAVETHGMVDDLADCVVDRAKNWFPRLPDDAKLFLNLHPLELGNPEGLIQRLLKLAPWGERVVLEITERRTLEGVEGWERAVQSLAECGFAIAVDDVGAGYSSLSAIADLDPRYVKIDMSIVRDVHAHPRKQRLVDLLCRFAEASGTTVVGEGVETEREAEALTKAGVHLLQGYHLGRPSLDPFADTCSNTRAHVAA
jgi:EAL domain-containing protein (putative c-di-GMP-specific phosphodiesterase class I)